MSFAVTCAGSANAPGLRTFFGTLAMSTPVQSPPPLMQCLLHAVLKTSTRRPFCAGDGSPQSSFCVAARNWSHETWFGL